MKTSATAEGHSLLSEQIPGTKPGVEVYFHYFSSPQLCTSLFNIRDFPLLPTHRNTFWGVYCSPHLSSVKVPQSFSQNLFENLILYSSLLGILLRDESDS